MGVTCNCLPASAQSLAVQCNHGRDAGLPELREQALQRLLRMVFSIACYGHVEPRYRCELASSTTYNLRLTWRKPRNLRVAHGRLSARSPASSTAPHFATYKLPCMLQCFHHLSLTHLKLRKLSTHYYYSVSLRQRPCVTSVSG